MLSPFEMSVTFRRLARTREKPAWMASAAFAVTEVAQTKPPFKMASPACQPKTTVAKAHAREFPRSAPEAVNS